MRDPLPPLPLFIRQAIEPLAEKLGLLTLPLHLHEIFLAFLLYSFIDIRLAPQLSKWLCPSIYNKLPARTRVNWNIHVVSLCQSLLICSIAFWIILADEDRQLMDAYGRIWGYNGATGMAQAFAAGYFLWDASVSIRSFSILGPGSLAHAISALIITSLGFRPFANFYGIAFVLYELSTPFLNFHWFFDKCDMTGSKYQLYNGITLLVTFFGCRICWGIYMSVKIYSDIYTLHGASRNGAIPSHQGPQLKGTRIYASERLPVWLIIVYLGSNTLLTLLNIYWIGQMLKAVKKRFVKPDTKEEHSKAKQK